MARTSASHDGWLIGGLVLAAVVATLPGFHLLELWMPRTTAMLISHGLGLVILGAAIWRWRVGRSPRRS